LLDVHELVGDEPDVELVTAPHEIHRPIVMALTPGVSVRTTTTRARPRSTRGACVNAASASGERTGAHPAQLTTKLTRRLNRGDLAYGLAVEQGGDARRRGPRLDALRPARREP
jgi:hypothetical protein